MSNQLGVSLRNGMQSTKCAAIQEIQGMGADSLLTENEDEMCERLVTKYQDQLPLEGEARHASQSELQSLANTIRRNVLRRKADFF